MDKLKRIGTYEVIKELGEGGFGKVFLVKKGGVKYALKVFISKGVKYMEYEYGISNVMTPISSSVKCPKTIACSVDKGNFEFKGKIYYYLVMEYIEGHSLVEFIDYYNFNDKKMPERCIIKFIYHILKGIKYLHSRGIAHNDIKPDNVIFNKSQLKLIDLGFGCVLDPSITNKDFGCDLEKFQGTQFYMSPEIYSFYYGDIEYDPEIFTKNDIWALGLTLTVFFDYDYYVENLGIETYLYLFGKRKKPFIPTPKKGKRMPIIFKNMIKECLDFDYKKRPTATELIKKLEKRYPYLKK